MKTITIPKRFGYPTLDVTVNGKIYTIESGKEITVEDSVAEVIENAIALAPKHERYLSKFAQSVEGSLTDVKAEDLEGITAIAACSFYFYRSLKSITIPKSVTKIGTNAFYSCSDLETLMFEEDVSVSIEATAFEWCSKLSRVYLPTTPPTLANANAFGNIKSGCVFYCKTPASKEAYLAAPIWSTLAGTYSFVVET